MSLTEKGKYQVTIIGGGSAGLTVAARLSQLAPQVKITLFDPAKFHYYQPLWTLVGGGIVKKEQSQRQQKSLIPKGVNWICERISSIHPKDNSLVTEKGDKVSYDFLIVAPGIQIDWGKIKGLREAIGKDGVCSNYAYEYVDYTWSCLKDFKGGKALFTFPNTPVKCAGAPQKILYLAEDYVRRQGLRDKSELIFCSAGNAIFGVKKYAAALDKIIKDRAIGTLFKHNLIEVCREKREAIFENVETKETRTLPYDLLHVTPPMSAPDFIKESPLADSKGWVEVDKYSLQHIRHPNVFSLGDASSLPTSKTGAAIRKQAPVLVANLLSTMSGKPLTARYNGYTSCPLVTRYGKLILAEFDYDGNPQETFPLDQSKERRSMYFLKRYLLPKLYWEGMLKGRA